MLAMRSIVKAAAGIVAVLLVGAAVVAHGTFFKPAFNVELDLSGNWNNAKSNASTRGSAPTQAVQLYMMDPPLNHTGALYVIGWKVQLQDEEAQTSEQVELSFVKYAADGVSPDESPTGEITKIKANAFGFPPFGQQTYDWFFTIGLQKQLPVSNHGVGIRLPAAPAWPNDGVSVHAQLNLQNDALRPRVPAPYNQQVWAYERPATQPTATPLGGRVLDSLEVATAFINDPVLGTYIKSNAYGTIEDLYGPESMHPSAARGDQLGFFVQGGNDGAVGAVVVMISPWLTPTPFRVPTISPPPFAATSTWYLDINPLFPQILMVGLPNPVHGGWTSPVIDFAAFPPILRSFWAQALIYYPPGPSQAELLRVTDVTGIQGQ